MRHITGSRVTAVGKPSYPNTFGKVSCKLLSPCLQVVALRVRQRVPKALARRLPRLPKTQRRSMHCHSSGSQLFLGCLASFGGILLVGRWYFPAFSRFYHIVQITSPEIFDFIANLQSAGSGDFLAGFLTTEMPAEFADRG